MLCLAFFILFEKRSQFFFGQPWFFSMYHAVTVGTEKHDIFHLCFFIFLHFRYWFNMVSFNKIFPNRSIHFLKIEATYFTIQRTMYFQESFLCFGNYLMIPLPQYVAFQ